MGKPVYELLGGKVHERLRSYTYLYPEAEIAAPMTSRRSIAIPSSRPSRARRICGAGLHRGEVRSGRRPIRVFDPRQPSLERLELSETVLQDACARRSARKADLLFGTHGQFTVSGALRLARRIEPYEPLWFEEPTPPEMPEEMAKVARQMPHARSPPASG